MHSCIQPRQINLVLFNSNITDIYNYRFTILSQHKNTVEALIKLRAMSLTTEAVLQSVTRHRNEGYLQEYTKQSRNAQRFIDVYIKVGNNTFSAHRLVLACFSQFFERLFQTPMKEQCEGTVNLKKLDGEAVRLVIEYMYVGIITINHENVFNLLETANFLQVDEVCQYCFDFLKIIISIENWSTILSTLHLYKNNSVSKQLHEFISANFIKIANSEKFKELKIQYLISIVQNLNQKVVKETSIYTAISSWIRYNEPNRKIEFGSLFLLINLHKLPSDFLEDVVATDPLVKENFKFFEAVTSAITKQFKEMRLREHGSKLISVGGADNPCKVAEVHSIFGSAKSDYPYLTKRSYHSRALELNGYIYSIGGTSHFKEAQSLQTTNKVFRLKVNDSEMKWEEVSPMNEERYTMGGAVFKDCLVVAGGGKKMGEIHKKVDIYIPALNKWQQISKLNQERMFNELVTCDGCLFVLGGSNRKLLPLNSVEMLSNLHGKWKVVEAMNEARAWFAAVSYQGEIYAIGGWKRNCNGKNMAIKSAEIYNPLKKKWTYVSNMSIERYGHAACVLRGKIYVVGGIDAQTNAVKTIECYDPATDKWTVVGEIEDKLVFHSLIAI